MRYLANEETVRENQVEDFILEHCWTKTIDQGPYHLKGAVNPDWDAMLVGDRFYALLSTREATYPNKEYPLKLQCGAMSCRKKFEWEVSIREMLDKKTKRLSPEHAHLFKDGNHFTETIPFSDPPVSFSFKLKTGGDAKRTQKIIQNKKTGPKNQQERQNLMIESLASYILTIDGVDKKRDKVFDYLEDLDLAPLDAMMPLIQSYDCGVDTAIDVDCPHCHEAMIVQLPFERAFFLPSSAAAKFLPDESSDTETEEGL
jgi:hypothetical protein